MLYHKLTGQMMQAQALIVKETTRLNQSGWGYDLEQYGEAVFELSMEAQWQSQQPDGEKEIEKLVHDYTADPDRVLAQVFCLLCGSKPDKVERAIAAIMREWVTPLAEKQCEEA